MHKIKKIEIVGTDASTYSNVKLIHTTAGEPFYSRTCAYNQMYSHYERTIVHCGGNAFENAPPIHVETIRYLTRPYARSKLILIQQLTASRLGTTPEERQLYVMEVERLKQIAFTNQRVVLFYFQTPVEDWKLYTADDVETLISLQIDAKKLSHITMPAHPFLSPEENARIFSKFSKQLTEEQTIFGQFHPVSDTEKGKPVLENLFVHDVVSGIIMTGASPSVARHVYYYTYCWLFAPRSKLMIAADVEETFGDEDQKLATHLALRRFGFDVTCRKYTYNLTGFSLPVSPDKTLLYDDNTGGMFSQKAQMLWYGKSAIDFIMENFPASTGLDIREYALCLNFVEFNRTGLKEAHKVMEKKHQEYISDRIYLQTFWNKKAES